MIVLQFIVMTILPSLVAMLLKYLKKKTKLFEKKPVMTIVAGVSMGLVAVYGTEMGVDVASAVINSRDAAVICAGIFFGWKPALIAAFIGGFERYLAPLWGVGAYTRLACSIATVFAGIFTSLLVKFYFKEKKLHWFQGIAVAAFTEIFHLSMVFVTHPNDIHNAFIVIKNCAALLVSVNTVAVILAFVAVELVDKAEVSLPDKRSVSFKFSIGLTVAMIIGFILTTSLTAKLQQQITTQDTYNLLLSNVRDVEDDIRSRGLENAKGCTSFRHIGSSGYIVVSDLDENIVSDIDFKEGMTLSDIGFNQGPPEQSTLLRTTVKGEDSYYLYRVFDTFNIIAVMPVSESSFTIELSVAVSILLELLVFAILYLFLYHLVNSLIIKNVETVNKGLDRITNGNLDEELNVNQITEFDSLSSGINSTVDKLKNLIDEANTRIDRELEFAKQIQHSTLPSVFPPFPNITFFDVFASMRTAKEVGGDFYDFFFTGSKKLFFMVADVSGKGIPAALFMMRAKTLLRSLASSGRSVGVIANEANNELCKDNDAGMFVTAWIGCLDFSIGRISYVNAGHNPPVLLRHDSCPQFLRNVSGPVFAAFEDISYKEYSIDLDRSDMIYLYTDGVVEATDKNQKPFSEAGLEKTLFEKNESVNQVCKKVLEKVDEFVSGEEQFDDITMLCLRYNEPKLPD